MYLTLETEEEHGDRDGYEAETVLWGGEEENETSALSRRLLADPENTTKVPSKATSVKLICSCGSYSCGYIRTFGLPLPVYEAEIAGLGTQEEKDRRARELRS